MGRSSEKNIKTDCFGYQTWTDDAGNVQRMCTAMDGLRCVRGECKFYKQRTEWTDELRRNHGKTDFEEIIKDYPGPRREKS